MNPLNRKNLLLLYTMAFLQGMVFYAPIASLYRQNCGLGIFQITLIESISLVSCILLELPWGIVADKIGYSKTMIICTFVYMVSKIIFWQADSFFDFLTERILLSISLSGLSGVDIAFLYQCCPQKQFQKACGIYESLGTAGLLISSVIFTFFLSQSYRTSALFTVFSYGISFVLSLFLTPLPNTNGSQKTKQEQHLPLLKHFMADKLFLLFLCSAALLEETQQNIVVFLNQIKYIECGLSPSVIGFLYILTSLAGFAGGVSWLYTKKAGEWTASCLCFLLPSLFCFLLAFTDNPVISALSILGVQIFVSLFGPLKSYFQNREIHTENRASILSLQAIFLECTQAGMSLIYGSLAETSLTFVFLAGGIFCLTGFFFFFFWYRKKTCKSPTAKKETS